MALRETFAFNSGQAYQGSGGLSGNAGNLRVSGGDSQGGVVRANPMTFPDDNTDGIPEFLAKSMEPYIQRKQQESLVKGMTDVVAGKTIQAVQKDDKLSGIFGPSSYHKGAAFATAASYDNVAADLVNNPALTQEMSTQELGTFLAGKYKGLMTGDPVADGMLNQKIMAGHGPLVGTLTKYAYKYGQEITVQRHSAAADAAAGSLQSFMVANAGLGSSTPETQANQVRLVDNFAGSLARPQDMALDSYQKFLVNRSKAMAKDGNFYAFETMKAKGLLAPGGPLGDDDIAKIETAYSSAISDKFAEVAHDPAVNEQLATLDADIRFGRIKSPAEIASRAEAINATVGGKTGIMSKRFISGDDILSMQKSMAEGQFSAGLRMQSHQWELEKEGRDNQHDIDIEKAKVAAGIAVASQYTSAGNVSAGIATGVVKEQDANLVFGRMIGTGNFGALSQNFQSGKYVNSFAASQLQSPVANSIGTGPTVGFKSAYKQWSQLNAANPSAAVAYYGDYAAKMEGYDKAVKGGETELSAYAQTFGAPPELGRVDLPEGIKRSDALSAVSAAVTSKDKWAFGMLGSRSPMAESSMNYVSAWLLPKAASYARASGISVEDAAAKLYETAIANGELERAGPFAWSNQRGATKLSSTLALPDDATDQLVTQVAERKLVAAGFSQGARGSSYISLRVQDPSGKPALYIQALNPDHSGHTDVLISLDELKAANVKQVQAQVQANAPKPLFPTIKIDHTATTARRQSYKHAMDGPTTDLLGTKADRNSLATSRSILSQ